MSTNECFKCSLPAHFLKETVTTKKRKDACFEKYAKNISSVILNKTL